MKTFFYIVSLALLLNPSIARCEEPTLKKATFAGGCFWCMQRPFDELKGVKETYVGYIGGHKKDPTYYEVSAGKTGHTEAVEITFDPKIIRYEKLLEVFWRNINPTTPDRQFVDVGSQYRPEIFYHDENQRVIAQKSRDALEKSGRFKDPIRTPITKSSEFYQAEDYHQKYYQKSPIKYKVYRFGSGRDKYLRKIWGKLYKH